MLTRWFGLFNRTTTRSSTSGNVARRAGRPTQACQVWTEFGTAHLSEIKHEKLSPLVALAVQKARA